MVGGGEHRGIAVCHRHADSRVLNHVEIVCPIAERHGVGGGYPQQIAKRQQGLPLGGGAGIDLNVEGHGGGKGQLREALRQLLQLLRALLHVREVELELLHARTLFPQVRFQLRHRGAQPGYQLAHAGVRDRVRRDGQHGSGHIAPVVLIAVVEHAEGIGIFIEGDGLLRGNLRPRGGAVLRSVVDVGAVGRDVPAHKGQFPQRLRDALVNTPRGGDDMHAFFGCLFQRGDILRQDVLFVVQEGPVEIECNEFN